ncbi:MAG: glycerophosphoryl diester phosphodiesterase [Actinomycetota bacterium]|nr:glycerophosphoryl diester phosphodiesterase [Actinomycetota bacterium]
MDSLLRPPIGFAHRGARAHAPENTIEAFRLALKLGATGLESDVWLTSDGVPVLDHDGVVRSGLRRRPLSSVPLADLPPWVPTLEGLYAECGTSFDLSLDVKSAAAAGPVISVARAAGAGVLSRLWLCHPDWSQVAAWRSLSDEVRLVDSTRLRRIKEGGERRAADLASAGVDAVNLHHSDWSMGLATLFHRFDRVCFGWDAQFERVLLGLLHMGLDGVFSDHVDRMVDALALTAR